MAVGIRDKGETLEKQKANLGEEAVAGGKCDLREQGDGRLPLCSAPRLRKWEDNNRETKAESPSLSEAKLTPFSCAGPGALPFLLQVHRYLLCSAAETGSPLQTEDHLFVTFLAKANSRPY